MFLILRFNREQFRNGKKKIGFCNKMTFCLFFFFVRMGYTTQQPVIVIFMQFVKKRKNLPRWLQNARLLYLIFVIAARLLSSYFAVISNFSQ